MLPVRLDFQITSPEIDAPDGDAAVEYCWDELQRIINHTLVRTLEDAGYSVGKTTLEPSGVEGYERAS